MVEHAGTLLRQVVAVDDMQDRRVAGIEPPARKLKRRPPPDLEPEQIAIKPAGRLEVVAQHREMVHCRYGHRDISCWSGIKTPTRKKGSASTAPDQQPKRRRRS